MGAEWVGQNDGIVHETKVYSIHTIIHAPINSHELGYAWWCPGWIFTEAG
jgi:hypothetical protein